MNNTPTATPVARRLYLISVFMLALTGFGQMPIFKRYYLADIPGLGWLAQFYVTHYMHYLFSILFLAVIAYYTVLFIGMREQRPGLKKSDIGRILCVAGLVVTGMLLVIRNLNGVYWDAWVITTLDLLHLGLVVGILVIGLAAMIVKKRK